MLIKFTLMLKHISYHLILYPHTHTHTQNQQQQQQQLTFKLAS